MNRRDKLIAQEATTSKIGAVFKINDGYLGLLVVFDGKFVEFDDGVMLFAEVVVGN